MLIFTLKKEWYEKIKSGEKTIEYREVKPYWKIRFYHNRCLPCCDSSAWTWEEEKKYFFSPVECYLQLGYKPETRLHAFIIKVEIVDGKDTDLHIDKPVYAIHLINVKEERK